MPAKPKADKRSLVYVHCRPCRCGWAFASTPIDADKFVELLSAVKCPMCGKSEHVFMGRMPPSDPAK